MTQKKANGRGKVWTTAARQPKKDELGPQASIVYQALRRRREATKAELTSAVKGQLKGSDQEPGRIVSYYLSQFHKAGLARRGKKAARAKPRPRPRVVAESQPAT